jgi:DNA-nicking Smr family endonuclease
MAKKRSQKPSRDQWHSDPPDSATKPVFNSPFKDLKKLLKDFSFDPARGSYGDGIAKRSDPKLCAPYKLAPSRPIATAADTPDDAVIFQRAIDGVRRLSSEGPARIAVELVTKRAVVSEDAEVLAQLSDLVAGHSPFDITETEEYVEGARLGIDPRLVTQLRRGEFSSQAHIDLHGMIQPDAKAALTAFVVESTRKGLRSIIVVHGRGLGSPGGRPILKHATVRWLSHGYLSGFVLAFTTARPADGGAGALYVLLKRDRRRGPFEVLNGAKRRD